MDLYVILAAVAGSIGVLVAAFLKGRSAGKASEKAKQAREELAARDVADEVDNDVGALTPEQRREALRKWSAS